MQFGCCLNMLSKETIRIGHEFIGLAERLGFDYVELPVAQVMELSEQAFVNGPLAAVKASGIPCLRMNNFLPASLRLTGPEARHEEALGYASAALDRAQRLGVRVVVMGSAGARNRPLHVSLDQAEHQLVDFLQALAPLAKQRGISIAIEHLNRLESNMVNSYTEGCSLARQVNHPAVGALLDTYHMDMVGEGLDSLQGTGALLKHVHVARTLNRAFPCDGDEGDYAALFAALKAIGYDGSLSLEANVQADFATEAAEALRYLKQSM